MPEYKPVPTVRPVERATPSIGITFPQVNFTGAIGQALGELGRGREVLGSAQQSVGAALAHMGGSLEHAGDEIFQRASAIKAVENQTAATEADTKFMMESAQMDAAFQNQMGNAASKGLDAHMKSLEDTRQRIKGSLTNDQARHDYDQQSLRTLGRTIFWAAHHAATQGKAAALGAATANFKMNLSDIENHADTMSPEEFQQRKQEQFDQYDRVIAPLEGTGKGPQAQLRRMEINSQLEGARINGIGNTDPKRALEELKKLTDNNEILSTTAQKLKDGLEQKRVVQAVRGEVDRATNDLWQDRDPSTPRKTEAERIQEAIDGLPQDIKDDPTRFSTAKEMVEKGVIGAVNRQKVAARDFRVNTFDDLTAKIYGPNGEIRDTLEKIWASDPHAQALYNSLRPTGDHSQKAFRDAIDLAVRKGERIDPFLSGQNREYVTGLAHGDIDQKQKLMDMNLWDPNLKDDQGRPLKLNDGDRRALVALRNALKKNPEGDPRVSRAWGWLQDARGQDMDALGIGKRAKTDDPNYIKARGALGDALEAYMNTHKGIPADRNAVLKEIAPEFLKHVTGSWFFGIGGTRPGYEQDVPAEWAEKHKKAYMAKHGSEPSESETFNAYWYGVWEQFYQGKSTPKPPATARGVTTAKPAGPAVEAE